MAHHSIPEIHPGGGHPLDGLREYLNVHQADSVFAQEAGKGSLWCLFLHGNVLRIGRIEKDHTYEFDFIGEHGDAERIHKVTVKMLCKADSKEEVLSRLRRDEAVGKAAEGPHFKPRYRHHIKNKTLYPLMRRKEVMFFTLLEGEVLRGIVGRFSRFEIFLNMKGGIPVVLMRHAIFDVRDKKGRSYLKAVVEKTKKYW